MEFGTSILERVVVEAAGQNRPEGIARVMRAMEEAGFSLYRVGDHVADPGMSHYEGEELHRAVYADPFSAIAWLSTLNAKLRFLVGVLILPFRHPLHTAHAAATLDQLTAGRFVLGVGSGYARKEFAAFGLDLKERFGRTEEYLQAIRALLSGSGATYKGRYLQLEDVGLTCPSRTPGGPPIWVGGVGPRAALRAARLGDAWFPSISGYARAPGLTPRQIAEMRPALDALRAESGLGPLPIYASTATAMAFVDAPKPFEGAADPRDRLANGTGGPEHLADLINAYAEAGVRGVVLSLHTQQSVDECLRAIDVFATKVKPRIG